MPTLDIFNDDAFSVDQLTQTIIDIPRIPTKLGDRGLFSEQGMTGLTMMIERKGSNLSLVPTSARGAPYQPIKGDTRVLIPVASTHLAQQATVLADEVQSIRAFGKETEVESVQPLIRQKLAKMKGQHDLTMEWHRVGALKGLILDADGTTQVLDIYNTFGMSQQTLYYDIATPGTTMDPVAKNTALKRALRAKLGGRAGGTIRVICSEGFFDKWTRHNNMKAAWDLWNQGQYLRQAADEDGYPFDKVIYEVYEGGVDGVDFIPDGFAYAYPEGVPNMFQTWYSPADYMETVNTMGLPYYAKQEPLAMNKGLHMESQSNPLNINTLPELVFKLSVAAS